MCRVIVSEGFENGVAIGVTQTYEASCTHDYQTIIYNYDQ